MRSVSATNTTEDIKTNQTVIKLMLRKCGITSPDIVDDGEKAALAAVKMPYDMVFMVR